MNRTEDWVASVQGRVVAPLPPRPLPPPPRPKVVETIDLTGDSDTSSPPRPRQHLAPPAAPKPSSLFLKPQRPPHLPLQDAHARANSPPSSSFNFASSSKDFAVRPSSIQDRLTAQIQAQNKSLGIPFAVPTNLPYQRPIQPAPRDEFDDAAIRDAMANLNVADNLNAQDQDRELKKLLEGVHDMDDVDVDEEPPKYLASTTKLKKYQFEGLSWLKNRESGGRKRGGILGDDMGLGKTVQMIALMLANPAPGKPKTTLIVCPVALMDQWEKEIEKHTDGNFRVKLHHGAGRAKEGRQLRKYDIVITSYQTVASEWVDPKKPEKKGKGKKKATGDGDDDEDEAVELKEEGALFDMVNVGGFYRIILDEAHQIKNRTSRQHKACCALEGNFRWCLTGTPVQNEVGDLFSLFEFLGKKIVSPMHEYSEFKSKIADPLKNKRAKTAMARLMVILKAVMLRRTKNTMVDGQAIVKLPQRIIILVKGPFLDADERAFYEAVENKMVLQMNRFLKDGSAMSHYTSILTLLLRMRQACSHPSLALAPVDKDALEVTINKEVPKAPTPPSGSSSNLLRKSSEADGNAFDVGDLLDSVNAIEDKERVCRLCSLPLPELEGEEEEDDDEDGSGKREFCASCEMEAKKFGNLTWSTKIQRLMHTLKMIKSEEGNKKTIVFSQFTSMFDLVEPFLKKGGFKFVRFDGKVDQKQRVKVLDAIKEDPSVTVILISIKSGSVGLNLTCCSRVILMDLWWNPQIEAQAFDRAHRMGQKEDVKIYKITVDDTIEDRILTLQTQKAELAKACLDGGDFKKGSKLNMADLMLLFKRSGDE